MTKSPMDFASVRVPNKISAILCAILRKDW